MMDQSEMNPQRPKIGRLLRPDQLQERLNISRSKAYRLISEGHFLALRIGSSIRVTEDSVDHYLKRQVYLYLASLEENVSDVS
jgi:excisionase family DNA binding protein